MLRAHSMIQWPVLAAVPDAACGQFAGATLTVYGWIAE